MKDYVPESHVCVDCGYDTAPGCPVRADLEGLPEHEVEALVDAAVAALPASTEMYMVREAVWAEAKMEPEGGCLCIKCLEARLGRRLRPKDFMRNHEFNNLPFPASERLRGRRGRPR